MKKFAFVASGFVGSGDSPDMVQDILRSALRSSAFAEVLSGVGSHLVDPDISVAVVEVPDEEFIIEPEAPDDVVAEAGQRVG